MFSDCLPTCQYRPLDKTDDKMGRVSPEVRSDLTSEGGFRNWMLKPILIPGSMIWETRFAQPGTLPVSLTEQVGIERHYGYGKSFHLSALRKSSLFNEKQDFLSFDI